MKFCKNCGNELAPNAKFCKNCGQPVASQEEPHQSTDSDGDHQPDTTPTTNESETPSEEPNDSDSSKENKPTEDENSSSMQTNMDEKSAQEMNQPPENQTEEGIVGAYSANQNADTTNNQPPKQPKKKMSKKVKVTISSIVALIIILAAGYFVGDSLLSPQKTVEKFEDAIDDEDAKTVASMVEGKDKDLTVDDSSVKGFIDYYNDNSDEMDDVIDHLTEQGEEDDVSDDGYAFNLEKDGKKFFLYDNYVIKVSPVYFEVYTNYADTEIAMNDDTVLTSDSDEFTEEIGPFLPGEYTFTANLKSDFVDLSAEAETEQFDPDAPGNVDLFIEGDEVEVNAPYAGALDEVKMYIDGEDVGVNVLEDSLVGPVVVDGSMTATFEGEFPWGTMTTDDIPIDSNYIDAIFKADEDMRSDVQDTIVEFNQEYLDVYTSADDSKFTVAADEVVEDVVDQAEYEKENDIYYQGKFTGVDFYEDSFIIDSYDDGWVVSVDTVTRFDEDLDYDPEEDDEDFEETAEELGYELQYSDDSWKVTYIGWADYMEEDKMIEYSEDDSKVYTSEWADSDDKDKKDKDKDKDKDDKDKDKDDNND